MLVSHFKDVSRRKQHSRNHLTQSSKGSLIVEAIRKQKSENIKIDNKQKPENEEVISPEVRIGPADKEIHSVSLYYVFMFNIATYI